MMTFHETKIPKMGNFVDKNIQFGQTPFPKVGRKNPVLRSEFLIYV
jgi:hypothetical protein